MVKINLDENVLLEDANRLPALPHIVSEVLQQIESTTSDAKRFEKLISQDVVLTARVLKLANSAFYGYSRSIVNLSEAIVILGLDTLKSLVIAVSAYQYLNKQFPGYGLKRNELWIHSLTTAMLARSIGEHINHKDTEQFFIGGLLHDIGKIILCRYVAENFDDIKKLVEKNHIDFNTAEKQVLGYSHSEVGSNIAYIWRMPSRLVEVTSHHHMPMLASEENMDYVAAVHCADQISYEMEAGAGVDGKYYKRHIQSFERLDLTKQVIEGIIKSVETHMKDFIRNFEE